MNKFFFLGKNKEKLKKITKLNRKKKNKLRLKRQAFKNRKINLIYFMFS